jgi:hypothetical protein
MASSDPCCCAEWVRPATAGMVVAARNSGETALAVIRFPGTPGRDSWAWRMREWVPQSS